MKKMIFAVALLCGMALPVAAVENATCTLVSMQAEAIMLAHQQGVPMSVVMDSAPDELHKRIAILAYETPRYMSEEMQQKMAAEFRDEWYLRCTRVLAQKK